MRDRIIVHVSGGELQIHVGTEKGLRDHDPSAEIIVIKDLAHSEQGDLLWKHQGTGGQAVHDPQDPESELEILQARGEAGAESPVYGALQLAGMSKNDKK